MTRADLDDFVACYRPFHERHKREETERFRRFSAEVPDPTRALCFHMGADSESIIANCTAIIRSKGANRAERSDAYSFRAIAHKRNKEFTQAIDDYSEAAAVAPDLQTKYLAYVNRGGTYLLEGNYDEANADYTRAIALEPAQVPAYLERASAYQATGLHELAVVDYTRAIALNPTYLGSYVGRALSYEALGRRDEAVSDYRSALRMSPSLASAQDGLKRLGASADTPSSAPQSEDRAAGLVSPEWLDKPTGKDLVDHYPDRAQRYNIGGQARLTCIANVDGALVRCTVTDENPPGYGSGTAALEMAPLFKMKPFTADGRSVAGAVVIVPIHFVVPQLPSPPQPTGASVGK
ncbi:MAG: tetratricopeptide repeat protein [Devosia sp.]|nr:tetratricopeptide repeat protein [Devosia sp.]